MAVRSSPAGYTFDILRFLQVLWLLATIPLLSIFMVRLDRLDAVPPYQLLYTLLVSVFALLYMVPTVIMHLCGRLSYTTIAIFDMLASGLFIAASVFLGRPLPGLSCAEVARLNYGIETLGDATYPFNSNASHAAKNFGALKVGRLSLPALGDTYDDMLENSSHYEQWVGRVGGVCRQMKGAWAGAIVLAILCTASAVVSAKLRRNVRRLPEFEDDEEMFLPVVQTPVIDAALREDDSGEESAKGLLRSSSETGNEDQKSVVGDA